MAQIVLPDNFIQLIQPVVDNELDAFLNALSSEPVTSIRINPHRGDKGLYDALPHVPWCESGRYLEVRPRFTSDPLFHAGAYYVQEASSMFLHQALSQCVDPHSIVLDMCAAPGGKSTLISSYLADDALLVSNEYVPQRAHILVENLAKWGSHRCVVTNNDTRHFSCLSGVFDAVCVDAPCSGEGMFRKEPKALTEWSLNNVEMCVERQREILANAWNALRPGGTLIYSTCTYNTKENEENVRWLITEFGAEYRTLKVSDNWNIVVTEYGYRFMPHHTIGEGLFLSVVVKPATERVSTPNIKLPKRMPVRRDEILRWLSHSEDFESVVYENSVYALPRKHLALILYIKANLNVMSMGVNTAIIKGHDLIPQQQLALSTSINMDAFAKVDINEQTAIAYLKTEAIQLYDAPRGFILLTYHSIPLGWVKNVGNRCNNLYPTAWRIRF